MKKLYALTASFPLLLVALVAPYSASACHAILHIGGYCPPRPGDIGIVVPGSTISTVGDFYTVLDAVIDWMLVFGILIGVIFVIWGGIKYMTSGGDESKGEEGKKIITGAIAGVVFLTLAWSLITIVINFFGGTGFCIGGFCI